MKLESRRCPFCDRYIDDDTKLYQRDGVLLGCEYCVDEDYVDEDYSEDEDDELEADYYDSLYDEMKMERIFGI